MERRQISINGHPYEVGAPFDCPAGEEACQKVPLTECIPANLAPAGEERKGQIEQALRELTFSGHEGNLVSDIYFYVPDEKKMCHAAVQTPPGPFRTFPEKASKITEIAGMDKIEVVDFRPEEGTRKASKVTIETANPKLNRHLDTILKHHGIDTGREISYAALTRLSQDLPEAMMAYSQLIRVETANDPENPEEVRITLKGVPLPGKVELALTGEALGENELRALRSAIVSIARKRPKEIFALMREEKALPDVLAEQELLLKAGFTPTLEKLDITGDGAIIVQAKISRGAPEFQLDYSEQYYGYLDANPDKMKSAKNDRFEVWQYLAYEGIDPATKQPLSTPNMQAIKRKMNLISKNASRNFSITFLRPEIRKNPATGKDMLYFILHREPKATTCSVELDNELPNKFKEALRAMFRDTVVEGEVNRAKLEETMRKAKMILEEGGFLVMPEIKTEVSYTGNMTVRIRCRRWSSFSMVDVVGEKVDDETAEKNKALIYDIISPLDGALITRKKLLRVKEQLALGMHRTSIVEDVGTDPQTGDTIVRFIAAEGKLRHSGAAGFGASGNGIFLDATYQLMDGHGNTYGIAAKTASKYSFIESWNLEDTYYHSLRLGFGTPTGKNQKVDVGIYGYNSRYKNQSLSEAGVSAGVTYTPDWIDGSVVLQFGGEVGYVDAPKGDKGYTKIPAAIRPTGSICATTGGLNACASMSVNTTASNNARGQINLQYTLPLLDELSLQTWLSAGAILGDKVPLLEQFTAGSLAIPFNQSFTDMDYVVSKYILGAAVAVNYRITNGFSVKPIVLSAKMIGDSLSMTVGACVGLGKLDVCGGWQQGIHNAKSTPAVSVGFTQETEGPSWLERFFEAHVVND